MKISIAQLNPLIGDFPANTDKILSACHRAAGEQCQLLILPELSLCGYPPQDLLENPGFINDHQRALSHLLQQLKEFPNLGLIIGVFSRNPVASGKPLINSAMLCHKGQVISSVAKQLLPTYDVFDERRYFSPGPPARLCSFKGLNIALTICEDIWNQDGLSPHPAYRIDPVSYLMGTNRYQDERQQGTVDMLVNIAASPFAIGKHKIRTGLMKRISSRYGVNSVFVNQCGGQDSLVFDGGSMALAADGSLICQAKRFQEDQVSFILPLKHDEADKPENQLYKIDELEIELSGADKPGAEEAGGKEKSELKHLAKSPAGTIAPALATEGTSQQTIIQTTTPANRRPPELRSQNTTDATYTIDAYPVSEAFSALVLGTRDFVRKCGFSRVLLGLSGGIDSALCAVVAVKALGAENVLGLAMPSCYSAPESLEDARRLAKNLNIELRVIAIDEAVRCYHKLLEPVLGDLSGSLAEQNLQSRTRGNLLMAVANQESRLLLSTGNKSEMAVGYCTLYGDMCGALAVLADVPKTMVYKMATLVNQENELIPANTIIRPPSAELAPDQRDDDDLPPYDILDPILLAYIEEHKSAEEIAKQGFALETVKEVIRRVNSSEHKRFQAPPGIKISNKAFGTGRRYPLAKAVS